MGPSGDAQAPRGTLKGPPSPSQPQHPHLFSYLSLIQLPGLCLEALPPHLSSPISLVTASWASWASPDRTRVSGCGPHLKDKETKAQKEKGTSPMSCRELGPEPGFSPGFWTTRPSPLSPVFDSALSLKLEPASYLLGDLGEVASLL